MNGFHIGIIFLGILPVIISLLCLFANKKKVFGYFGSIDEKKRELLEIINDAEQMIEELNRFSDYIVSQMDLKYEELCKNLERVEERIRFLKDKATEADTVNSMNSRVNTPAAFSGRDRLNKVAASGGNMPDTDNMPASMEDDGMTGASGKPAACSNLTSAAYGISPVAYAAGRALVSAAYRNTLSAADHNVENRSTATVSNDKGAFGHETGAETTMKNEKVIPFVNKYSEVLRLSRQGMGSLDIAKSLKMGKGEVELIVGLNR